MNNQTQEALKMAIEAFELEESTWWSHTKMSKAYNACKEALEQPAQEKELIAIIESLQKHIKELKFEGATIEQPAQEPVAWLWLQHGKPRSAFIYHPSVDADGYWKEKGFSYKPLYTHPNQWQGLTDDEVLKIYMDNNEIESYNDADVIKLYRDFEQALKEKNT
jgi:hypothetical protein